MHRSPVRDRQKVWWVTIEEIHEGIDNIIKYGKPDMLLIINLKVSLSIQLREWGYLVM